MRYPCYVLCCAVAVLCACNSCMPIICIRTIKLVFALVHFDSWIKCEKHLNLFLKSCHYGRRGCLRMAGYLYSTFRPKGRGCVVSKYTHIQPHLGSGKWYVFIARCTDIHSGLYSYNIHDRVYNLYVRNIPTDLCAMLNICLSWALLLPRSQPPHCKQWKCTTFVLFCRISLKDVFVSWLNNKLGFLEIAQQFIYELVSF